MGLDERIPPPPINQNELPTVKWVKGVGDLDYLSISYLQRCIP
jgi:hypothetical protein